VRRRGRSIENGLSASVDDCFTYEADGIENNLNIKNPSLKTKVVNV